MMDFSSGFSVNTSTKKKENSAHISPAAAIKDAAATSLFLSFFFFDRSLQKQSVAAVAAPLAFGIQEFGHAQLLLRYVEGVLEVVSGVGLLQSVIIHQIGPEIDRGGEGQRFNGKKKKKREGKKTADGQKGRRVFTARPAFIESSVAAHRCLCMRALKAMPSFQLVVKLVMLMEGYLQDESRGPLLALWQMEQLEK